MYEVVLYNNRESKVILNFNNKYPKDVKRDTSSKQLK
jgi:hypothetical protein